MCRRLLALFVSLPGCLGTLTYECMDDTACVLEQKQGECVAPGACAYPDAACDSLLRFGPAAGPGLASTCVEALASSGVVDVTSTSPPTCGPCEPTPGDCHAGEAACVGDQCVDVLVPEGTACREDDPCVVSASCDAAGICNVDEAVQCDEPPGPCHQPQGTCGKDGVCTYALKDDMTPCEDGNGCTLEDACDDLGMCRSGPICPTDNPCAIGSCGGSQCTFFPVADATACGAEPSDLCCAGACIDASTDALHCGGCDVPCPVEQVCVPMETTGVCMPTSAGERTDVR